MASTITQVERVVNEGVVAVVGIGYVGLPLAVEFGKVRTTIGFDTSERRIAELRLGVDRTKESARSELHAALHLSFTSDPKAIRDASIYIVTVPTPIDASKRPNLESLQSASETVGGFLSDGDLVVYESTV